MRWPDVGERVGYCDLTGVRDEGCLRGRRKGAWSNTHNLTQCFELCRGCERCRFTSFSHQHRECAWFTECPQVKTALSVLHRTYRLRYANGTFRETTELLEAVMRHNEWPAAKPLDFFERPRNVLFHQQSALNVYAHSNTPPFGKMHVLTPGGTRRPLNPADLARWARLIAKRASLPERGFASCAVVGSSGELLEHRLGAQIDAHDAVWRVNAARVDLHHQAHVGTRTTVRVWGFMVPPPDASRLGHEESILMRCPGDAFVSQCWHHIPEAPWPRISPLEHRRLLLAIHGENADKVRTHPSTGAMAVWAALSVCTNVSVVGYGGCSAEGSMHYDRGRNTANALDQAHNITSGASAKQHDMHAEWAWLERLASEGVIKRLGGWRFRCT